jgi:hypothetical protein
MLKQRTLDNSLITAARVVRAFLQVRKRKNYRVLSIGDSHAAFFHSNLTKVLPRHQYILCWLGARLMFSVSQKGFGLTKVQKIALRIWRPEYCFVWLGEIDVRTQLVKHNASGSIDLSWLEDLLDEIKNLWKALGQPAMILFSPVPQSETKARDSSYPAFGGFQSRYLAQEQFIQGLEKSFSSASFPVEFCEVSTILKDETGQLNSNFTDDNCHLNSSGFDAIKSFWAKLD